MQACWRMIHGGFEALIRGVALLIASYTLLSLLLTRVGPTGYDANIWWVDLRALPDTLRVLALLAFSGAFLHRAIRPKAKVGTVWTRRVLLGLLVFVLLMNTISTLGSSARLGVPVPLTAVLAVLVLLMLGSPGVRPAVSSSCYTKCRRGAAVVVASGMVAVAAALAQMFWFGETDYRRPADAIVVFGCKAYADGRPSQALADRVHTACELYHQGHAQTIIMSGGPVRGAAIDEPQVMADYAVSLGVPREAIVLDPHGLDTRATATNLRGVLEPINSSQPIRILAVSHDYHLPRVKLSFQREGVLAYTVPCEVRRGMPGKPYFIARETAAWWWYYLRPLASVN